MYNDFSCEQLFSLSHPLLGWLVQKFASLFYHIFADFGTKFAKFTTAIALNC